MSRNSTTWQKGTSGNPAGKPPSDRALTKILAAAGNATVTDIEDKRTARKRVLARLLWEVATTGQAVFPDGKVLEVDPADYLAVVKFLYQHIDGPPKQTVGLENGNGGPLVLQVIYENKRQNTDDPLA